MEKLNKHIADWKNRVQKAEKKAEAGAKELDVGSMPKFTDKSKPTQIPAKDASPAPVIF